MSPKKLDKKVQRTVALCYIRLSFTRDADDTNSPERQRANIQAVCERNGWTPEWYEDVGGHRSGRSEKGRPQWLALKARIGDADVIALVANDLSRLHRKGWRVGDLIEFLTEHDVNLVLAAPGRDVDTTTMKGRLFLQFGAIIDEFYAEDISQRAKENVAFRKARGLTIGMPPFGTVRGEDGYLQPSSDGAWLLPNGTFVAGEADTPPAEGALWRSYYETAHYILSLYGTGKYGLEKIAYTLTNEGWPFRDRTGVPRMIWRDDIRRVVANWPEYGGLMEERKAKDRPAYEKVKVDELPFRPDRAVFPVELLKKVAQVRQERTRKPANDGVRQQTYPYPLTGITYCAHCEQLAKEHNNPKLRSRLGGKGAGTPNEVRRYRHKSGVKCGALNRSIPAEVYEKDFARLIRLLTIKPEALELMTELAIQADRGREKLGDDRDLEREKQEAIALCNRRIEAAIHLYSEGRIDKSEYLRRVETNEREIAHWEARTSETEKVAVELGMCIEAVNRIAQLWDGSNDEDRQGLIRSLFDSIVYDLDRERIVDFRLKSWADRFIVLRAALYSDIGEDLSQNETTSTIIEVGKAMPHRSYLLTPCLRRRQSRLIICFLGFSACTWLAAA